jgi:Dihaem cytochrome c
MRKGPFILVFALAWGTFGCNASLPDPGSPAAQLYRQRCSSCHRLYAPSILTAEMWKVIVARMEQQMRQAGSPPLSADESRMILDYLQKHSSNAS